MFAPLFLFAALMSADAAPSQTRRVSVVAHSMGAGGRDAFDNVQFVAERLLTQDIEVQLRLSEVVMVPDASVDTLCANNATDYVLEVQATPVSQVSQTLPLLSARLTKCATATEPASVVSSYTVLSKTPSLSAQRSLSRNDAYTMPARFVADGIVRAMNAPYRKAATKS